MHIIVLVWYKVCVKMMLKFSDRGQRRAVERQAGEQEQPRKKSKAKKKTVSPEMQERQERAAARMLELKIPPLQVRIS